MPRASTGATAPGSFSTKHSENDPYKYQVGFGNKFASEALPDVLPDGQNMPQKNKFGLYTEGITGSPFISPRAQNLSAFVYRIQPSVAHKGFTRLPDNPDLESCFLPINPKVHVSPTQLSWSPFEIPSDSEQVDFVSGIKTLAGNGDPTLREGLAISVYLANTSMDKKAFCNSDGDMLIVPQQGRLDIQTEFGMLMVKPGELCVVQRGIKFKVVLPDGPSRGYIQEIFGSHFELPELGPLGSHGLANPRDFEFPLARFDLDQSKWHIVYKMSGQLHLCIQDHTPFDVVAWHGNFVPYKYDMEKFIHVGSISKDHIDPSIFCVLTAKSKKSNVSLSDFLIVHKRWDVATNTFRLPYYHRNTCSEFMALLYGSSGGRVGGFQPGGASHETGFCPHGVSYEFFKAGSEAELKPEIIHEGRLLFMIETSVSMTITDYAMKRSGKLQDPKEWVFREEFMDHLDEVNKALEKAGRPALGYEAREYDENH